MKTRLVGLLALIASVAIGADYTVAVDPTTKTAKVTLRIATASTDFRMPAWSPGDYRIVNYGQYVRDAEFMASGKGVAAAKVGANSWHIAGGADEVRYTVPVQKPGIFSENLRITESEAFLHGPAVLGYFEGHTAEAQSILLKFPDDAAKYECALPSKAPGVFDAPDYDTLIDSPAVMGPKLRVKEFGVKGKQHKIVGFGRSDEANLDEFATVATGIIESAYALFGELPYDRFYFMFDFGGAGGGLEHLNSTRMAMWPGMTAKLAANFMAHEYFHTFNVKRIRPKPLGPFDYTKPAVTGTLWWAEGVTDYYAELLTYRAGLQTKEDLLSSLSQEHRSLLRNPARLKVSADESSRRVWEANNSSGFDDVDYYQKGKVIGLVLDLAIRGETNGTKSLDHVMRALYAETKGGKPGFAENRIRDLCIQVGGEALGGIYDSCVMQPVELPLARVLSRVGLVITNGKISPDPKATPAAKAIVEAWLKDRA